MLTLDEEIGRTAPGRARDRLVVPGAYSTLTVAALAGTGDDRPLRGTVLGVSAAACYLAFTRVGLNGGHRIVVPLLRPHALRLPTGVVLTHSGPWPVDLGGVASAGVAGIDLGPWRITMARQWRPAPLPSAPLVGAGRMLARLEAVWSPARGSYDAARSGLHPNTASLVRACAAGDDPTLARMLSALVGLGPGLTPSGDDALCGALLTLRALGHTQEVATLAARLPEALTRTTDLSASLVHAAADGHAVPELIALLSTLAGAALDPSPAVGRALVEKVLAVGHSSGTDLLIGVHATLTALTADTRRTVPPTPVRPPRHT